MVMEIPYILTISAAVLFLLRMLPGHVRTLVGPHHVLAAMLLPVLGYYGVFYAVFALGVIALVIVAPAVSTRGLIIPHGHALDLRAKLFMFCLPLMPMLKYTLMFSGLTFFQFTFANLLSIGFILAMLRSGVSLRSPALAPWDIAFGAMLAMQIVMDARGNHLTFALRACLIVLFNLGIPYFAISRACYRSPAPGSIMLACIVSGCILAIIAGFESHRHWLLYDNLTARIQADADMMSGYAKERGGLLRARVTWTESTGLSLFLGVQFVMLVALRRLIGSRLAFLCLGTLLMMGVFFTFARVGYVMIVVGLVACFVYERRWGYLAALAISLPAVGGAAVLLAHFIPQVAASIGMGQDAGGTVDYRSQLLSAGMALFRSHWLTGMNMSDIYGSLGFMRQGEGIIDLVNEPLTIFMRGGLFGGLIYYAILFCVLVSLFRQGRRLPVECRAPGGACFAALVGLTVSLTTTSYGRNETTYVVLLAFAAGLLARGAVRRAQRPSLPEEAPRAAPAFSGVMVG